MIAFAHDRLDCVHDRFVAMLPQIKQQAAVAFRSRQPEEREELVQEVIANTYVAFARLVELDKVDLAYATPLAMYAVRQVVSGRRVGSRLNVRDVMSPANRRVTVEQLHRYDHGDGAWKEVLVEDKHAGPAETAAARIDVADWFKSLARGNPPCRQRQVPGALSSHAIDCPS